MQESFTIQIAGLNACVQPLFESTRHYCASYLTTGEPEIFVPVTKDDLVYEQKLAEIEAVEEGLRIRKFTDPFLERATIQRKIALELIKRDTILFHGSTVAVDGFAYLFTAPCGTGKSTHTRLWMELFGSRAVMVNDDKAFLQITSSGVYAYGSPWSGKHGLDTNVCMPLKGICILQRGLENVINRIEPEKYISELRHQSFIPQDPRLHKMAVTLVDDLSQIVPLWGLKCVNDISAAHVSYDAMSSVL